jgi:hypothetical protein
MWLFNIIVSLSTAAGCKPMMSNVSPPWSKEDINGYIEVKMRCDKMRKYCVTEFFKTAQGYYRGVCSDPIPDNKSR